VDDDDNTLIEIREISGIPGTAIEINEEKSEYRSGINQGTQLVSDLIKSAANVPRKAYEVVFNKEIIKGIKSGTYKFAETKAGETMTTVVDASTKKIVAQGRLQTNQMARIGAASFQFLSIAVAQAHLADISENLERMKNILKEIQDDLHDTKIGEIEGNINILAEELKLFHQENTHQISEQKFNLLQNIAQDAYKAWGVFCNNIKSFEKDIIEIKDSDWWGTGNTYQAVKEKISRIERLEKQHELICKLRNAHAFFVLSLDPFAKVSRIDFNDNEFHEKINQLKKVINNKISSLFSSAITNDNDTLKLRKDNLLHISNTKIASLLENQKNHILTMKTMQDRIGQLTKTGAVRMAIAFDDQGEVKQMALM